MRNAVSAALAAFSMLLAGPALAAGVTLSVLPAAQTVSVGSVLTVRVVAAGLTDAANDSIGAYGFDLSYDPAILAFQSARFEDPGLGWDSLDAGSGAFPFADDSVAGVLGLSNASFDLPEDLDAFQPNGSFTLLELDFLALTRGQTLLNLPLLADLSTALSDASGLDFLVVEGANGAAVTVVPVPPALWLLGSALLGLVAVRRRS